MDRIIRQGQRFQRRVVTEAEARAELADEPYKLELIGLKGGDAARGPGRRVRRGRRRRADDLRQRRRQDRRGLLERPVPRPAPAQHPHDRQRLGAHAHRGRVLARLREEQAAPARVRHGLADQGRAARPTRPVRRRRSSATTASSAPNSTCSRSRRRSGRDSPCSTPRAESSARDGGLSCASATTPDGYELRLHPAHHQGAPVRDPRHLGWYADGMFPPMHLDEERDAEGNDHPPGPGLLPQAHELPVCTTSIFRARGRSYRELPLRLFEFGTVYRNEKSGILHGLTRVRGLTRTTRTSSHPGAGEGGAHPHARLRARRCCATTASPTSTSSCRRRTPRSMSATTTLG